jgi:hypothetical protein
MKKKHRSLFASMEEQFHNWLIEQGAIPQICHDKLPKLEAGCCKFITEWYY